MSTKGTLPGQFTFLRKNSILFSFNNNQSSAKKLRPGTGPVFFAPLFKM